MNVAVQEKRTGLAIASLVLSILGIISYGLASILGVIFGHMARNRIRLQPQVYGGHGMATAGLILGYLVIGGWVLAAMLLGGLLMMF